MRTKRAAIVIIAFVAIAAAIWTVFSHPQAAAVTNPDVVTLATTTAGKKPAHQVDWTFAALPDDPKAGTPMAKVSLAIDGGSARVIGTYIGNCFTIIGSAWELQPNETSGAICYYAGGGKEIGVFTNPNDASLSVMEGNIDEGSAETPGTRGSFHELFKVAP